MKTVQTKASPKITHANVEVGQVSKVTYVTLRVQKKDVKILSRPKAF